jgi:hypothetical protein
VSLVGDTNLSHAVFVSIVLFTTNTNKKLFATLFVLFYGDLVRG